MFPLSSFMTSFLGQNRDLDLPIYIPDISSFGRQSLLMILLLIVTLGLVGTGVDSKLVIGNEDGF